jgi:fumarate hydratase class II
MTANVKICRDEVERSPAMATGLNAYIGYEQAAKLVKEAAATGKTIRQLCREKNILPEDQLEKALDPWKMTRPG